VPILADDDAREVFAKVTVAAEMVLTRSLPGLIAGTAARTPQRVLPGEYFGRRTPADGRIDWSRPAREIHNLVRALAPPFPGAFGEVGGERWEIQRTRLTALTAARAPPQLRGIDGRCYLSCGDGTLLALLAAANARGPVELSALSAQTARQPLPLR
jgi:methionyl-tRNA formyltransferase